ncbi:MAG TPA: ATP-binding protein [Ramlibacter sp.]|jgi:PAS domain S-box-containing protein|uniref:hybrid sensor histidine kinase/response regulator n=1 Tax=Ramlibacter sp. TaxID=1917967 RepID=UPI002D3A4136|nr:ATP-binding protein [Ramlibacter sp.]HZY20553.1 ATP-binding protein [Ramlibacter sp.]
MLSRIDQPPHDEESRPSAADPDLPDGIGAAGLAETLRQKEELLRLALDAGGMGIWQVHLPTGRSTWWPGMELLHGLPPGTPAAEGESYYDLVHPEDRERVRAAIDESIRSTGWHRTEYRVFLPEGGVRWLEGRGCVRRDADDQPVLMAGVCLDITRRKHIEHDLKFLAEASAELAGVADYETTLDRIARLAVPHFADWCAVDLLQPDGTLERVSAAHVDPEKVHLAHELHRQFPPDPASTSGTWNVLRTGQGMLVPEITFEMLQAGTSSPELLDILRNLGLRSYIGVPLSARGRTMGVLTFITAESGRRYGPGDLALAEDLARRAAVAIDNAQLLLALRESDRAKDVFLATLAHELRNPLAPIWNGLSIIKRARGDPVRIEQVGDIIERQVGQLSRLVDDLLDVSRIGTGKVELKKEPTNLVSVIASAVEISRPHIEAAHHKLSISFPDEPTDLVADPARLAQVFSNLLNNAAKYTRKGGRIDLSVEAQPEELVVRVQDNGTGIAPDMLGKVFGLFTQVKQPTERRQGGLGIGLSLVEGLVRLHGGHVEAFSAGLEQGSEFVVRLPRQRRAAAARAGIVSPSPAPATQAQRRVLVVDDNEDAASTVAELLQMSGNDVRIANDGATAVARTAEFRPDVVLLDIGLPDFDGYEVARRIRRLEGVRQPILIALTGWGQQQDKDAAARAGFDHHWTKPVDPARLQELSMR